MTCSSEMRAVFSSLAMVLAAGALPAAPATFAERVAPVLERNCTVCHGDEKHKAGLRLDSHAAILRGAESGAAIKPGDAKASELMRRITLPPTDEDFMPSEGKPPLTPAEVALLEKWIQAGAPETAVFDAPALPTIIVAPPAAPDYRPRLAAAEALANTLGVRLVPRSRVVTDGLVLRTASAPTRCDDAALARLAPFADLIVEAELARTKITDAAAASIATWTNLRVIDLSRTAVTSAGIAKFSALTKLESLNVTATHIDEAALEPLRHLPAMRRVWAFAELPGPAVRPGEAAAK